MVWPTGGRRPASNKHAFEEALDEALLDPDGGGPVFDGSGPLGPAVGSLGDVAVASGYVAPASLARAYGGDKEPDDARGSAERPREAARKLKAALAAGAHAPSELAALRRRFAARNHPDRVPEDLREEAMLAMAEINAEIDSALTRAKGP